MSLAGHFSRVLRGGFVTKLNPITPGCVIKRQSSIWEPDYLIYAKTKVQEYDEVNVQLKGYDFAVLDKYTEFIRSVANHMSVKVLKVWPAPQKDLEIHHYRPNSSDIVYKYTLKEYERNIQVVDVKSTIMALFIEAIATTCPPGVSLDVHKHESYMEEDRYVPNAEIAELQSQIEQVGSKKKGKKKIGGKK